jgi:hypothetical protein
VNTGIFHSAARSANTHCNPLTSERFTPPNRAPTAGEAKSILPEACRRQLTPSAVVVDIHTLYDRSDTLLSMTIAIHCCTKAICKNSLRRARCFGSLEWYCEILDRGLKYALKHSSQVIFDVLPTNDTPLELKCVRRPAFSLSLGIRAHHHCLR